MYILKIPFFLFILVPPMKQASNASSVGISYGPAIDFILFLGIGLLIQESVHRI